MSAYQADQIQFVLENSVQGPYAFKLKVQGETHATKWMDVSVEQLRAIRAILAEDE